MDFESSLASMFRLSVRRRVDEADDVMPPLSGSLITRARTAVQFFLTSRSIRVLFDACPYNHHYKRTQPQLLRTKELLS